MAIEKNRFLTVLSELQGGGTANDLHAALAELIAAVQVVGKPGKLVLTLTVTPKSNSPQLLFEDDIKMAPPKPERETTILYADEHGHISRRDPRQPKLEGLTEVRPFRTTGDGGAVVDTKTGEVR